MMAVWQATFEFLSVATFPTDYRPRLSSFLPQLESWAPDLERWGTEDGHRIDVWLENGRPVEASVRFDLRVPFEPFCIALVQFTVDARTSVRAENGLEVAANLTELTAALNGSRAARFVENPGCYFNRLRAGGLEDL